MDPLERKQKLRRTQYIRSRAPGRAEHTIEDCLAHTETYLNETNEFSADAELQVRRQIKV